MNTFLFFGAAALALLLPALTLAFAGILWWSCRKQNLLASVPWLIAFSILSGSLSKFSASVPEFVSNTSMGDNRTMIMWGCGYLLLGAVKGFLSVLMIIINAAFLIQGQVETSFVRRLASMQKHQSKLGVILLLLVLLGVIPVFYQMFQRVFLP